MATHPRLLTAQEVADLFRVSVHTVNDWRRKGVLEAVELPGGGGFRFQHEVVERFIPSTEVAS